MAGILFEDIFDVKDIDPEGKKFDRGELGPAPPLPPPLPPGLPQPGPARVFPAPPRSSRCPCSPPPPPGSGSRPEGARVPARAGEGALLSPSPRGPSLCWSLTPLLSQCRACTARASPSRWISSWT